MKAKPTNTLRSLAGIILSLALALGAIGLSNCDAERATVGTEGSAATASSTGEPVTAGSAAGASGLTGDLDESQLPAYDGSAYAVIAGNVPSLSDIGVERGYESYADLDSLGRCGEAMALVGAETMPAEKRGSIGSVKPSGWRTVSYDDLVDGRYLYNRCHLIGYQLSGENANERNLITGTRYLNVEGMLPFEDEVAGYVRATGNHVLYRATPVFAGDELVARGVHLEALSIEDGGEGVSFNVFCHNVQPGIEIDYATGDSWVADEG